MIFVYLLRLWWLVILVCLHVGFLRCLCLVKGLFRCLLFVAAGWLALVFLLVLDLVLRLRFGCLLLYYVCCGFAGALNLVWFDVMWILVGA